MNPYTDNQNLFDAFLAHSTVDSAVPDARPILNYALLDIENQFGCAEGHINSAVSGHPDGLVTFHFWASDFRTREAAGEENTSADRIVSRNGVQRVAKARAGKDHLFEIFFGPDAQESPSEVPAAGAAFIEQACASVFSRKEVLLPSSVINSCSDTVLRFALRSPTGKACALSQLSVWRS